MKKVAKIKKALEFFENGNCCEYSLWLKVDNSIEKPKIILFVDDAIYFEQGNFPKHSGPNCSESTIKTLKEHRQKSHTVQ